MENDVGTVEEKPSEDKASAFFSYERLKCRSEDPAPGVDPRRREVKISVNYS